MQVILLEYISKLGQMGDEVQVKQGYGRNYLLPQGKALRANDANRATFAERKAVLEAQNLETRAEAESIVERLDGQSFTIIRSSSDAGALYGSVSSRDIALEAETAGFSLDKKQIKLLSPIKALGIHVVSVELHPEVSCEVQLNVARSEEEAKLQAKGKSIQDVADEADAAAALDHAELFDDMGAAAAMDDDMGMGIDGAGEEVGADGADADAGLDNLVDTPEDAV